MGGVEGEGRSGTATWPCSPVPVGGPADEWTNGTGRLPRRWKRGGASSRVPRHPPLVTPAESRATVTFGRQRCPQWAPARHCIHPPSSPHCAWPPHAQRGGGGMRGGHPRPSSSGVAGSPRERRGAHNGARSTARPLSLPLQPPADLFPLRARGRTGHHLTVMPVHSQARGSPAARCGSQTQQGPVDACFFHGGREGEEWPAAVTVPPRAPLRFDGGVDILQALAREVVGWRGCTHLPPLLLATPPRVLHLVAVVLPLLSRAVMSRLSSTRRLPPLLSQHDGLVDGCSQQMSAPELPLLGTGQFPFLPARG